MKDMKRLLALLLCAAMLLGMVGCSGSTPAADSTVAVIEPTDPPAPTAPPADVAYGDAAGALAALSDVTLDLLVTTTMTLAGETFTTQSAQTLTYSGIGSDAMVIAVDETIKFNIHDRQKKDADDSGKDYMEYSEVYADGFLYTTAETDYLARCAITAEEAAERYAPVVLLDSNLYGAMTSDLSDEDVLVTFSEPTAPESWAIPEDAEMLDASGSAIIGSDGSMQKMAYTVSYNYGPAQFTLEVESRPQAQSRTVTVPENADQYIELHYADALKTYFGAIGLLVQADAITSSSIESAFSQAGGVLRNQSTTMNLTNYDHKIMTKVETNLFIMDYSSNQSQKLKQEEVFKDGKYTITVDDGVPTTQSGVEETIIKEYCSNVLAQYMGDPSFWEDVTVTDLGGMYFIEYTYSEDFGNTIQNAISKMFYNDPAYLNKLATEYVNNEMNGYLSVDKYTGIPVAVGFNFKGTHTIQSREYPMTMQCDQSFSAPNSDAYQEITDKMLPESEPENKATPVFYHVTGDKGQEMWLLGTIHVGDARTAYLPQEIRDAFAASDALALECDTEAFDKQMDKDEKLAEKVSNYYFYSNGKTLESKMGKEAYAEAVKYFKATGNWNMNTPYAKPCIMSSGIEAFYLQQGYQLTSKKGVEERLRDWAEEMDKEIREVESNLFQIEMLTGFSDELQLKMLEDTLDTTPLEYCADTWELYEKWCVGDEDALREELSDEVDTSEMTEEELAEYEADKKLIEEYNKKMSYDRNKNMLQVAKKYLESGDVVFYAVGLAHLLNNVNGLVDALRDAGYTVELVQYAK